MSSKRLDISGLQPEIKGDLLTDDHSLGMYATDASIYQIKPLAVVLPRNESDVKKTVAFARRHKLSLLPRGGGTSLAGQTVGRSIVLDFSKYMNRVIELNAKEHWVRVQPGLVRDELNEQLAGQGLHFAPDPATSSRANVGGMVGNNSSGTKSILYGKTVDHVLAVKVLLADGTEMLLEELSPEEYRREAGRNTRKGHILKGFAGIIEENREEIDRRFPKVMRRVGGYNLDEFTGTDRWNLARLITGSEGTLATILEIKLNLEPLPEHKSVAVLHFSKLPEALRSVKEILKFRPAAVEILDSVVLQMSRQNLTTRRHSHFLEGDPAAILITEFYGDSPEEVLERPRRMIEHLRQLGVGYAYPLFPEGEAYEDVWIVRKKGLGLMLGLKGDKKPLPFIEDAAVPVEVLPQYIDEVLAVCRKYDTDVSMYAHASVGVIHVRPILDLRRKEDIENLKNISAETFDLVVKYGGAWSGEHGDGLVRSAYNERFFGRQLYSAFREVKALFDPEQRMNPGKIVNAPPMDQNLRYGADYHDRKIDTEFHYRTENSFRESVHMCTGVGECRKTLGGTMCPSFKATRDEEHSTRGRANALRLAMSGQLDDSDLASPRLHRVMDLCISCKACKSECPSNVDMAKMKSEVAQVYMDKHGLTLRDRMIRDSSTTAARLSGPMAGTANALRKTKAVRSVLHRWAGLDRRRVMPAFAPEPFSRWFERNNSYRSDRKVALFADTFMNYHEPQIGISAVKLLNSCGYEVLLADVGCCQRPRISHGLLRLAKKEGAATIAGLEEYLDRGLKVVVCEPSCASALNDDFPDLVDDEATAARLKENVMIIDLFLAEEMEAGRLATDLDMAEGEIWLHGHCHQKALYGTKAMKKIAERSGRQVREIPSGCCGMAGSFGYETEHYELSEKIGEQVLFPAVRSMPEDALLVASGFSCRHQIEHFTGVKPRHWVEVVRTPIRD